MDSQHPNPIIEFSNGCKVSLHCGGFEDCSDGLISAFESIISFLKNDKKQKSKHSSPMYDAYDSFDINMLRSVDSIEIKFHIGSRATGIEIKEVITDKNEVKEIIDNLEISIQTLKKLNDE